MDPEKKTPSCIDQFERQPEHIPDRDGWTDGFVKRLRILLDRLAGKK